MFFFTNLRSSLGEGVKVSPTLDFNPVRVKRQTTQGSSLGFKGWKVKVSKNTCLLYYTIYNKYNSVIYTLKTSKTLTPDFSSFLGAEGGLKSRVIP
jgi:hypothetical protein